MAEHTKAFEEDALDIAQGHLGNQDDEESISKCKEILTIAQESGDKDDEMSAYIMLSEDHLSKEEFDDAIFYGEKCVAIAQGCTSKVSIKACITLGKAHLEKKDYDEAIYYSELCLAIAEQDGDREKEMNAYKILGKAHLKKKEYDDAIFYSEICLAVAEEYGDIEAGVKALEQLCEAKLYKREYDDAIFYAEKCLTMAKEWGSKDGELVAYLLTAQAYQSKGEHDEAIVHSEKCLAMAKELGNKEREINAYLFIGQALLKKGEHDEAIVYWEKCLVMAEDTGDKEFEIYALGELAKAHLTKGEHEEAIAYCEKRLALAKGMGDKEGETEACITIGLAHLRKGENEEAIVYGEKCVTVAQESGNKLVEMFGITILLSAQIHKGELAHNLFWVNKSIAVAQELVVDLMTSRGDELAGIHDLLSYELVKVTRKMNARRMDIYSNMDKLGSFAGCKESPLEKEDYDDAVSLVEQYLTFAQELGNKEAEMFMCLWLGSIHLNNDKSNDAYFYFKACRKIAEQLENKYMVALSRMYLSSVYESLGMNQELMRENLGIALSNAKEWGIFQSYDAVGIPGRIDPYLSELHERYCEHRQQHEYEQAICCLEDFILKAREKVSEHVILFAKYSLSEMYVLQEQYDKGMKAYLEVFDTAQKKGNKHLVAQCHSGLGEIYYKLGQTKKAEESIRKSLESFELLFDDVGENDQFKIAIVEKHKQSYKLLFKVLVDTGKEEEALLLADSYRARALKDILLSRYGMKIEQSQGTLQYDDIQALITSRKYTLLFYSTSLEELCTFLIQEGDHFEFFLRSFKGCDRCLDQLVHGAFEDMKVREVVGCEDRSLGLMDDFNENKSCKEQELKGRCHSCVRRCVSSKTNDHSDNSTVFNSLEKLHQRIINDVKKLIKQDEIVILPEGPLFQVPFPALRDPDTGQYLSETKRIRLAPSMTTLKLLQERPDERHFSKDALVIGDPLVGRVMMDGLEKEFDALEGALEEAADIALILKVRPLLAAKATKPSVLEKLQQGVSIVHIAAHGSLSKASIVLAPSAEIRALKIPEEDDYMLTMADVQQAKVRAELVVLSCCHSGRGQIKAEGVVGMCRAFLASGARAVIGSLWAIDDEATRKFMKKFYKYLRAGKSASTSLNLTMNDMRRKPQYREPRYWAPFFLMGDDVTITF